MRPIVKLLRSNEEGYAVVITLMLLLILTVIGIAATTTSTQEVQISGNAKKIVEDFFVAEGALFTMLERTDWLDDDFFNAGVADSSHWEDIDFDDDGRDDAKVEVRCVVTTGVYKAIPGLSDSANDIPYDMHIGPPTVNSGYSLRYFVTRKYSVTSTALRAATDLQSGVWKVFNKF